MEEDLYSIIDWWEIMPNDFNDIETLINKRKRLNVIYVRMGKFMRDIYKEFGLLHGDKRIKEAKKLIETLTEIDPKTEKFNTLGKSQAKALLSIEDIYRKYYDLQGTIDGTKVLMDTVNTTLYSMQQEIKRLETILNSNSNTDADRS